MPVNATRSTFTYGAEMDGTGKSQHYMGVGAATINAQQGEFRQVAPNFPLQVMARATGGEFVANDTQFSGALDRIAGAYYLTYQADRPADGRLHRLEIRCTRPGVRLRGRQYAASGSLRGVAATRGQRILAGERLSGGLEMSAAIMNIARADKGLRAGDLRISAQIGDLRAALRPLDLGQVRVTVVVEVENGPPFVNHQEFKIQWDEVLDSWQYGAGFRWPKKAHRAAVLVEELVTSTWGATIVELD
jgi:hypothetical protein